MNKSIDYLKTPRQAASIIGCCEKSVYNFIKQNKLKPVRIGGIKKAGRTYVHIKEIEKFMRGE
ncbi:helix-turn-helix domain-containing protein [Methanococcoides sp. SA1]|nr:helix-turn-helix domain-containing protein [Methanococcoides sp. SA1]